MQRERPKASDVVSLDCGVETLADGTRRTVEPPQNNAEYFRAAANKGGWMQAFKCFRPMLGSGELAWFLTYLLEREQFSKQLNEEWRKPWTGWFYLHISTALKQQGYKPRLQQILLKKLIARGFIFRKLRGRRAKRYLKFNDDLLGAEMKKYTKRMNRK